LGDYINLNLTETNIISDDGIRHRLPYRRRIILYVYASQTRLYLGARSTNGEILCVESLSRESLARSVCGLFLGIAVLFTCGTARAQILYVLQNQAALVGIVSTYNATTGAVLSPSLIAGLREPLGLAINSNSNPPVIFVAADHVIGKYHATTGSAINPVFIHTNPLGARPHFLLLSGTTLYVGSDGTQVDTYDATTGAKIKVPFISAIGSISGLALSGNVLYVSDRSARKVDEYDASTGVLNTSFSVVGGAPYCLAVYADDIFVAQWGPGQGARSANTPSQEPPLT
jgi:hypothetical protein